MVNLQKHNYKKQLESQLRL